MATIYLNNIDNQPKEFIPGHFYKVKYFTGVDRNIDTAQGMFIGNNLNVVDGELVLIVFTDCVDDEAFNTKLIPAERVIQVWDTVDDYNIADIMFQINIGATGSEKDMQIDARAGEEIV